MGQISLFANEVPEHQASHLYGFNYSCERGQETPTALLQPADTRAKQMQPMFVYIRNRIDTHQAGMSRVLGLNKYLYKDDFRRFSI